MRLLIIAIIFSMSSAYAIRKGKGRDYGDFQVKIRIGSAYCTGVRISKDYILSVAHCFKKAPKNIKVVYYANGSKQELKVATSSIVIKGSNLSEELAIIPIPSPSANTNFTSPTINSRTDVSQASFFTIWGVGTNGRDGLGRLRKGFVQFNSMDTEVGAYKMMIAEPGANNNINCAGDSGGPIFREDSKELVGVVSFINHSTKKIEKYDIEKRCKKANRAYYVLLSEHMDFLAPYLDTTNLP